jgi:hypothetical protein
VFQKRAILIGPTAGIERGSTLASRVVAEKVARRGAVWF